MSFSSSHISPLHFSWTFGMCAGGIHKRFHLSAPSKMQPSAGQSRRLAAVPHYFACVLVYSLATAAEPVVIELSDGTAASPECMSVMAQPTDFHNLSSLRDLSGKVLHATLMGIPMTNARVQQIAPRIIPSARPNLSNLLTTI